MTQEALSEFQRLQDEQRKSVITFASESVLDQTIMQHILIGSVWSVRCVSSCREAVDRTISDVTAVVICERQLPDGYWTDLFEHTRVLNPRPEIIVTSRSVDNRLWAEVLNVGGHDVLAQPFDRREVVVAISSAWHRWQDSQRVAWRRGAKVVAANS